MLKADYDLRPLSRIQVFLEMPHHNRAEAPSVSGYVTRTTKAGIGIEWCDFSPPIVSELLATLSSRRYVRLRKPDSPASLAVSRLSMPLLKHGT
jgi:hypothetical protein